MTSTTLTTAPIAKSVQVPKKVRIVPIASSFFFARRSTGGSFRFPKQSVSGSDSEAIDRICVYIIDIVFVWVSLSLSPSLRGRETLQQLLESSFRRRPTKKRELLLLSRARERERERERATVLIQPFIVARDKEGHEGGGRRGPSWMMM